MGPLFPIHHYSYWTNDEDDLFADINNFGKNPTQDAFDTWIKSPTIANAGNSIAWWASMLSSGDPLVCMALDFLSAPGTIFMLYKYNVDINVHAKLHQLMLSMPSREVD